MKKIFLLIVLTCTYFSALPQDALVKSVTDTIDPCSKLESKFDEFENTVNCNTRLSNHFSVLPVIAYKRIKGTSIRYYLLLRTHGQSVSVGITGAHILFTDGTKLYKPVEIDVDVSASGESFLYTAHFPISQSDRLLLSKKTIKKFRLYIYDEEVTPAEAEIFKQDFNCLLNFK